MGFSEQELVEEIIFRAKEAVGKNVQAKEGKIPPDTPAYGEFWPWVVYKIRPAASEKRMLFGMKAEVITCWLDEARNIKHVHLNFVDYGYSVTYEELDLTGIKHPTLDVPVTEIFKQYPLEEGIKLMHEAIAPTRPDKSRKLHVEALYLEDFANAPTVEQDKPLSEQRIYEPRSYPDEVDAAAGILYDNWHLKPRRFDMFPLPPTMKGFLLMSKDRFQKWLREVTWPLR